MAACDRYTRNCSDIEGTSGGGEHERECRPSCKEGSGDLPREIFLYMVASVCILMHFGCFLGVNFSSLGLIWHRQYLHIHNGTLT